MRKSYAYREIFVNPVERDLFWLVSRLVDGLKSYDEADHVPGRLTAEVRCHELARAVAKLQPGLLVVDGKFGAVDHSWLVLIEWPRHIIDVYTPGSIPQVQLIHAMSWSLPARYYPGPARDDIREDVVEALAAQMNAAEEQRAKAVAVRSVRAR